MLFGEPLHVNVSRASTRFETIQRAHSRQLESPSREEEEQAGENLGFDLRKWLRGRQQAAGPPFAKRAGLSFKDLSIYGTDVSNKHIATLITPFWKLIKGVRTGWGIPAMLSGHGSKRQLTHSFSGLVREGEMLLVLGRPGSGCSTLLRVLGNQRKTYTAIEGRVSYGGLSPEEIEKHFRGEVAYSAEEDTHYPTITIRRTLEFAIECKTPSTKVLANPKRYQQDVLDMLLDMYGLRNSADNILMRASGGEKKRTSIAELVATGAAVEIFDNSSRGLDSSTALDYARSLRIGADVLQKTIIATLYQASESIYELFDKVMVIDEGRQLYFGPTTEAVAYFEALGVKKPARQTTSDFLSGLTQMNERQTVPGFEDSAPITAVDFEQRWLASTQYQDVHAELDAFEAQVEQDDRGQELRELVNVSKMGATEFNVCGTLIGGVLFMKQMLDFAARHGIRPMIEKYPMSRINEALQHVEDGKARHRVVL
ncbi:ATP-binding cassette transporter snq2 [Coemansia sp. RSA 2705]|nr:ATP-binding cassette transporter snq2 [Coemansia sp. RSA 2705]